MSASPASLVPWREAMGFGLGLLRLAPRDFWTMTPRELAAAADGLRGGRQAGAPTREALEGLMRRFPD